MHCGCRVLSPPLEICTNRQNCNTYKAPPARPCCSPQCRLNYACFTLQRLHLTLQCPRACPGLPTPKLKNARKRQDHGPHKPPAQLCHSTQRRLHHTCCTLQRLHLNLQCLMSCPGLAAHTLRGLCALQLPSSASSSEKYQKAAKTQPPQTTCPAMPQHPVPAPPHLLHTAEPASDLGAAHGIPRAGQ